MRGKISQLIHKHPLAEISTLSTNCQVDHDHSWWLEMLDMRMAPLTTSEINESFAVD